MLFMLRSFGFALSFPGFVWHSFVDLPSDPLDLFGRFCIWLIWCSPKCFCKRLVWKSWSRPQRTCGRLKLSTTRSRVVFCWLGCFNSSWLAFAIVWLSWLVFARGSVTQVTWGMHAYTLHVYMRADIGSQPARMCGVHLRSEYRYKYLQ